MVVRNVGSFYKVIIFEISLSLCFVINRHKFLSLLFNVMGCKISMSCRDGFSESDFNVGGPPYTAFHNYYEGDFLD